MAIIMCLLAIKPNKESKLLGIVSVTFISIIITFAQISTFSNTPDIGSHEEFSAESMEIVEHYDIQFEMGIIINQWLQKLYILIIVVVVLGVWKLICDKRRITHNNKVA